MDKNESYKKGLMAAKKKAMQILKETEGRLITHEQGLKFAYDLSNFAKNSASGTSWQIPTNQLPAVQGTGKDRFYDVRITMKLDVEKIKEAVINPEGYEDYYEDDVQGMHDDEAKVDRYVRYDYLVADIYMYNSTKTMSVPRVELSWENRIGEHKEIVTESINYVTEETFNNVLVDLIEYFVTGDGPVVENDKDTDIDKMCLNIPEDAAERYGLLLKRV